MVSGICTNCKDVIIRKIGEGRKVIDANSIVDEVLEIADFSNVSATELRRSYVKDTLSSVLSNMGFRSVIRGEGYFVELGNCSDTYKKALLLNARRDATEAEKIFEMMRKTAEIDGQMAFNMENGGIIEELSREELLEMLKNDSVSVS